jgi:hypothetical protein
VRLVGSLSETGPLAVPKGILGMTDGMHSPLLENNLALLNPKTGAIDSGLEFILTCR